MNDQNLTDNQINVMVAEAAGWTWSPDYNKRRKFNDLVGPSGMARVWRDGVVGGSGLPKFSTSVDACMELIEQLRKEGFYPAIHRDSGIWEVAFFDNDSDFRDLDDSLPWAICKAFLRVRGKL